MPKTEKQTIGKLGEDIACQYLRDSGWKILFRNENVPGGEIDVIARQNQSGLLAFVEVKTRSGEPHPGFKPEDLYRFHKSKVTQRSCRLFAGFHQNLFSNAVGWRIDLITIQINKQPVLDYKKDCTIHHYENV